MSFLTRAGEAQIANKQANQGRVNISHFVFAYLPELGEEPEDRVEELPASEFIVDTQPYLKVAYVNDNQVVYSVVLDSTIGDYRFNWIGLVDEEEVLIATAYITPIEKRKTKGNKRGNTISRNFLLKYTGIQKVTAASVPAETWQLDFTERFWGVDERERLSNLDLYAHASFLGEAWSVIDADGQYQVAAGTGYVGGIRVQNSEIEPLSVDSLPTSVWLEASLQGNIADRKPVTSLLVQTDAPVPESQDANGVTYYRTKLADISADGAITDARTVYENVAQHEAKADPHPQYKAYTDSKTAAALTSAKSDATRKSNAALASAKDYTDSKTVAALTSAKSDATQKSNTALASAKDYTDSKTAAALTSAKSDATQKSNTALASAKDYTDSKTAATLTSAKSDATQKSNAALASARQYADQQADAALAQAKEFVGDFIGSIHFFASSSAPVGFLKANGAAISRTTYAALFSKIGTQYGAGNGSTTFNVPDLRGEFIRGWDEGRGVDSGRGLGSKQGDAIRNISGSVSSDVSGARGVFKGSSGVFSVSNYRTGVANARSDYDAYRTANFDASKQVPTASENRPRNVALAAYIKY